MHENYKKQLTIRKRDARRRGNLNVLVERREGYGSRRFPLGLNKTVEETQTNQRKQTSISQLCIIEIDGEESEMNFRIYEDRKAAEMGIKICNLIIRIEVTAATNQMLIEFCFQTKITLTVPLKRLSQPQTLITKSQRVYRKSGSHLGISTPAA